ncbi:hypothetical protein SR187_7075 [Streptococcus ruminantium]|uniref:Uncharacterized protein n=1 Tax=Streptococcus ruminantium TaxID=1917441 RepID=A0A2Z5TP67_9STRE|nr:hypothetical protein SR187_7075 [Streptococcus ruminantium]
MSFSFQVARRGEWDGKGISFLIMISNSCNPRETVEGEKVNIPY